MDIPYLLKGIPANAGYAKWVRVGHALFSAGQSFEVWDDWSKGSEKYPPGYAERVWRDFEKLPRLSAFELRNIALETNPAALDIDPKFAIAKLYGYPGVKPAAISMQHLSRLMLAKYNIGPTKTTAGLRALGYEKFGSVRFGGERCLVWTKGNFRYEREEILRVSRLLA